MPEFRQKMAEMMKQGKAFKILFGNGVTTVHPTDELLDAYYCAKGLK